MKKLIYAWIWGASEFLSIPLGRFAPAVFEGMTGLEGKQINKDFEA